MNNKTSALLLAMLSLTACAQAPVAPQPTPVELSINEAANDISKNLIRLAAIEQSERKPVEDAPAEVKSVALNRHVSVVWNGGIEPLVHKISEDAGYRFRIIGRKPAIPVMVAVDARNQPMAEILRNIGLQAGSAADVLIFENEKVIEVRYAG